jgi:hypothetical protein
MDIECNSFPEADDLTWFRNSRILWNPEIQYRVHRSQLLVPILSQLNPLHTIYPQDLLLYYLAIFVFVLQVVCLLYARMCGSHAPCRDEVATVHGQSIGMLEVFSWFLSMLESAAQSIMHLEACSRTLPGHCITRATNISLRLYLSSFQALLKFRQATQYSWDHKIAA